MAMALEGGGKGGVVFLVSLSSLVPVLVRIRLPFSPFLIDTVFIHSTLELK